MQMPLPRLLQTRPQTQLPIPRPTQPASRLSTPQPAPCLNVQASCVLLAAYTAHHRLPVLFLIGQSTPSLIQTPIPPSPFPLSHLCTGTGQPPWTGWLRLQLRSNHNITTTLHSRRAISLSATAAAADQSPAPPPPPTIILAGGAFLNDTSTFTSPLGTQKSRARNAVWSVLTGVFVGQIGCEVTMTWSWANVGSMSKKVVVRGRTNRSRVEGGPSRGADARRCTVERWNSIPVVLTLNADMTVTPPTGT